MAELYEDTYWYPTGALALNAQTAVFPEDSNVFATLWADAAETVPLANPLTTDAAGVLTFYAAAGQYWVHMGEESFLVDVPGGSGNTMLDELFTDSPFYIAHRGSGAQYPEHTMIAYESSVAAGASAIEMSVFESADGVLFAFHDTTLDRMTNGTWTGSHATWTWAALNQQAKIVSSDLLGPGWADQLIPTVREVLDRFAGEVVIFAEAKGNSAVVPLRNLLLTYPDITDSVVWKAYYSNPSLAGAQAAGFRVWAYMDDATTSAQLDAVDANVDYWGVPITAADAQFQAVQARTLVKPIISWPIWRRFERDRLTTLGVQGVMASEYQYLTMTTAIETFDSFDTEVKAPGQDGGIKEDPLAALKFDGALDAAYVGALSGRAVLMGSMSPIVGGAGGYRISFEMMFPVMPGAGTHAGITLGKTADDMYQFGVANPTGGYHMLFRPNLGELQLYRHDAGVQPGVQLGTVTTAPVIAAQWIPLEVDVTPTQVILRRTDAPGWLLTVSNTQHRGLYWHLHNGSLVDPSSRARFRNIAITPFP